MDAGPNDAAQYGMVTACYFALFMYRYNKGYIVISDRRAIFNIMLVFIIAQPLCRIMGGRNGLLGFIGFCISSIIMLPSPTEDRKEEEERKKKNEREVKKKKRTHKGIKNKTKTS